MGGWKDYQLSVQSPAGYVIDGQKKSMAFRLLPVSLHPLLSTLITLFPQGFKCLLSSCSSTSNCTDVSHTPLNISLHSEGKCHLHTFEGSSEKVFYVLFPQVQMVPDQVQHNALIIDTPDSKMFHPISDMHLT